MSTVMLTIDERGLRRAHGRAPEQGTSVERVVSSFLESYDGEEDHRAFLQFVELAETSRAGSEGMRRGSRESLYEDRWRRPRPERTPR